MEIVFNIKGFRQIFNNGPGVLNAKKVGNTALDALRHFLKNHLGAKMSSMGPDLFLIVQECIISMKLLLFKSTYF